MCTAGVAGWAAAARGELGLDRAKGGTLKFCLNNASLGMAFTTTKGQMPGRKTELFHCLHFRLRRWLHERATGKVNEEHQGCMFVRGSSGNAAAAATARVEKGENSWASQKLVPATY